MRVCGCRHEGHYSCRRGATVSYVYLCECSQVMPEWFHVARSAFSNFPNPPDITFVGGDQREGLMLEIVYPFDLCRARPLGQTEAFNRGLGGISQRPWLQL